MGGEMPIEGLKKQEAAMMKDRESRLGRFLRSSVLGTAPREEDTVQTIVRLEFEKGAVYNAYIWGPRRILGIRGFPELPPLRFLPTSDREFVAFSLEGGGTERTLSFDERDGKTVLTLATLAGPITRQVSACQPRAITAHSCWPSSRSCVSSDCGWRDAAADDAPRTSARPRSRA
jgi:hypothetical protein